MRAEREALESKARSSRFIYQEADLGGCGGGPGLQGGAQGFLSCRNGPLKRASLRVAERSLWVALVLLLFSSFSSWTFGQREQSSTKDSRGC